MNTSARRKDWILATTILLASTCSYATPVAYQFIARATSGPVSGASSPGYFTFDDSIIPVGGGNIEEAGLFSSLEFSWMGTHYTTANADTGFAGFAPTPGVFTFSFGNHCVAAYCDLSVPNSFFISAFGTGIGFFAYRLGDDFGSGSVSVLERCTVMSCGRVPVPSPGTGVLMGIGLLGLSLSFRKRLR